MSWSSTRQIVGVSRVRSAERQQPQVVARQDVQDRPGHCRRSACPRSTGHRRPRAGPGVPRQWRSPSPRTGSRGSRRVQPRNRSPGSRGAPLLATSRFRKTWIVQLTMAIDREPRSAGVPPNSPRVVDSARGADRVGDAVLALLRRVPTRHPEQSREACADRHSLCRRPCGRSRQPGLQDRLLRVGRPDRHELRRELQHRTAQGVQSPQDGSG